MENLCSWLENNSNNKNEEKIAQKKKDSSLFIVRWTVCNVSFQDRISEAAAKAIEGVKVDDDSDDEGEADELQQSAPQVITEGVHSQEKPSMPPPTGKTS